MLGFSSRRGHALALAHNPAACRFHRADSATERLGKRVRVGRALGRGTAPVDRTIGDPAIRRFVSALSRILPHDRGNGGSGGPGAEHAHRKGIIHRDIKPANLLIDVSGNLWITDFGLARFQDEQGLTLTGDVVGTLRYMSPEQAAGDKAIDGRTDVYSLGATLYELLTMRPVFDGRDRHELLRQIALADPPRRGESTPNCRATWKRSC